MLSFLGEYIGYLNDCHLFMNLTFLFLKIQIRFKADPSGTHFWHSHTGFQRADGVVGSLIVREPDDPHGALYDHDLPDHVVLIQDWLIEMTLNRFTGNHHSDSDNKPKSALINGNRPSYSQWQIWEVSPCAPMKRAKFLQFRGVFSEYGLMPLLREILDPPRFWNHKVQISIKHIKHICYK